MSDKKTSNDQTVENSNKKERSAIDWVCDNATPLIVGATSAVAGIMIYNYLTRDDDDDCDNENSFINNVNDLLR